MHYRQHHHQAFSFPVLLNAFWIISSIGANDMQVPPRALGDGSGVWCDRALSSEDATADGTGCGERERHSHDHGAGQQQGWPQSWGLKVHVAWPCCASPSVGGWEPVPLQRVSCTCSTRCGMVPSLHGVVWSPAMGGFGEPAPIHSSDLDALSSHIGTPGLQLLLLGRAAVAYRRTPHQATQPLTVACCFCDNGNTVAVLCDVVV